uniref:GTPase IMAP family member 7-like n=1 Tax=Monopterus albus TaxID=43700 RepID=UPI0009B2F97D|nr:GTPase IMAP family member 7-like [Monopterus albus]
MNDIRIVLLGKTGSGKSSLANTIFNEDVFEVNSTANPGTRKCQTKTKQINGRSTCLIDTPGFFGPHASEDDTPGVVGPQTSEDVLKSEIARCITECAPGPHAFLILLKVEKFTKQEKEVIDQIEACFSEEAFKYAVVVFTHGDQLPEGTKIEKFVQENKDLHDLMEKCGNRYHVIDNKYWKNNQQDEYRNNQVQVEKLFETITKLVEENNGLFYTNEMLQEVQRIKMQEEERIRQSSGNMSQEEIREQAKTNVSNFLIKAAGITTGVLLGALLGVPFMVASVVSALSTAASVVAEVVDCMGKAAGVGGVGAGAATGIGLGVAAGVCTLAGAAVGGCIGYQEAEQADSAMEAAQKTAKAVWHKTLQPLKELLNENKEQCKEQVPLLNNT